MRIPVSSYRIQLNPRFGFDSLRRIVPYLSDLGISHVYVSPVFKAVKGSVHGYDIVDSNELNPELGPLDDFEDLIDELKCHKMGWLQDIVPNHAAYDTENKILADVLKNGARSRYFKFFDIEWDHYSEGLKGKILAPFLSEFYSEALEKGEIRLKYAEGDIAFDYHDFVFPLRPESYAELFEYDINRLKDQIDPNHPDYVRFLGALHFLKNLSPEKQPDNRYDRFNHVKMIIWELYLKNRRIKNFIEENIIFFNGKKGLPGTFNPLDKLLSGQLYRLSFWKVAREEINYRRFFSINNLISIKVEEESVLNYTHDLIYRFVREDRFSCLRVDHIDGLADPLSYLKRIREKTGDIYIAVEKILDAEEKLPSSWPVQGTTGYDFMNYVNGVFCDKRNAGALTKIYNKFTGQGVSYEELLYEKKRLILGRHMAGDIDNLAQYIKSISLKDRYGRDITLYSLKRALVEVMASFSVYRTYINHEGFTETDRFYIEEAVMKARERSPGLMYEFNFIEKFLLLEYGDPLAEGDKKQWVDFVMRFQQFTAPLTAKGFEDTVCYIYNRLISLNEVGGYPDKFGVSPEDFHKFNADRFSSFPYSMNAASTHDTKRSEDVRARINVLSEIPSEWDRNLKLWHRANLRKKKRLKDKYAPDVNDEYFLYQTLLGAFPFDEADKDFFIVRIRDYMIKAIREAKVHTAWIKPDSFYEDACLSFINEILSASDGKFLNFFQPFQKKIAFYGIWNSLSQTLVKMTCPGIPDVYQGTELWDFSLVDPDNRRPVDFEKRARLLRDVMEKEKEDVLGLIRELLSFKEDGRIKLFLMYRIFQALKKYMELFQKGEYISLDAEGVFKSHVICFARKSGGLRAVVIAPRFFTGLISERSYPLGRDVWKDTAAVIPDDMVSASWENAITGEILEPGEKLFLGDVLREFPAALLIKHKF
jgi:(1->4)-alpha-D-glucan 1-alpha-D-glucosylmutase